MDKSLAIKKLYLQNFSGPEIARRLNVNLRWVYRCLERQSVERRTSAVQNRIRFENSPLSFSFKNNLSKSERELLIAAIMLYYGEGAKTGKTIDFANSDPVMIKIFLKFLREICNIDKGRVRFYLYCFSNQDPGELINYWCKFLKIRRELFTKPYVRKANENLTRVTKYGVLHVRYSDTRLLKKILDFNKSLTIKILGV